MQNRMPLVEAMLKYKNEKVYPFHTPGHKGGRGMEALLKTNSAQVPWQWMYR